MNFRPLPETSQSDPPQPIEEQREMFFPTRPFRFYPVDMGFAFGITAGVFMLVYIVVALIVNATGISHVSLQFFEQILPGFQLNSILGCLLGIFWSLVGGFVIGFGFGFIYNWRLRSYVTG